MRLALIFLCLSSLLSACSDDFQCQTHQDCFAGEQCYIGRCVITQGGLGVTDLTSSTTALTSIPTYTPQKSPPATDASDMPPDAQWPAADVSYTPASGHDAGDSSGALDMHPLVPTTAQCPGRPPRPGDLVINEVLVNVPAPERGGDANGDGIRDAYEDEFVELVNTSPNHLNLDGIQIANDTRPKMTFPPLCLAPDDAVLVFGGPKGLPPAFDATLRVHRFVADSRFGFNNESGLVRLRTLEGQDLFLFAYDEAPFASYQLWPELSGRTFRSHQDVGEKPKDEAPLFSPGRCTNGLPLHTKCREP